MDSAALTPGVIVTASILLTIAVLSVYVSRVFLPTKIRSAYKKSITALAAAVETKDSGTVGHAQRVAQLAADMGRRLGLSGRELERIEFAALVMDLGKANVPQSILAKRERLTEKEWETVKRHSDLGAEMISGVPFLAPLREFVLHHHEFWDGSGYPNGLKGEEIPLASRILCVAADYDAMVSDRPYHPRPLAAEEAVAEIQRGSGTRYDPKVAAVFLEMMAAESGRGRTTKAA